MNYLAHLFLSCHDPGLMTGNFLGDFVHNRDIPRYPKSIQRGIRLHRRIDAFTDNHPLVIQGMRRMYPEHGRYGAVIIDVFYDFLLIGNWSRFTDEAFPEFRQHAYAILLEARKFMPRDLQGRVTAMTRADWLAEYATYEGIEQAIKRVARRASRPQLLVGATKHLRREYEQYNEEFIGFFPDAMRMVQAFCENPED